MRWYGRVVALQAVALGLLGLSAYVRTLPPTPTPIPAPDSAEAAWWGLWPVTYLPPWAFLLGVVLTLGTVVAWWLRTTGLLGDWVIDRGTTGLFGDWVIDRGESHSDRCKTPRSITQSPNNPITHSPLLYLTLLLILAFFLFPLAHTRWGDAFMLAKGIAFPDPALRLTHSWQAPLDVFVHSQLWLALHAPLGWEDAMPAYRLLSPLAGTLYLLVVLALSRDVRLAPGWVTYGLLASLGLMQLFFGYVENYSFAAAGVLAYLWLGLGVARGERSLWQAATLLAITNATHPSTIILAPSLLYLAWQQRRNQSAAVVVLQVALPMLLVGGATFLWMEGSGHGLYALLNTDRPGGGDARWFVPLWATSTRWEHYTMFSWLHLRDWLNEQLLVAPVVLPALAVVGVAGWIEKRQEIFLALATFSYLLFTFVWNPDYGGQRDWDLFSLAALPATVWLILSLPHALGRGHRLWGGVLPLIAVQAWHTAAWIYQNTLPWQWPD